MYARPIEEYEDVSEYKFSFAVVFPDGKWCLSKSLKIEDIKQAEEVPIFEAIKLILAMKPDVVISGMYCRSGHTLYTSLIEILGLRLIGPTTEAAIVTSNKAITRRMLTHAGVPMPPGVILSRNDEAQLQSVINDIGFPCIVKSPCIEDSIATVKVHNREELANALNVCSTYSQNIVIEKFIRGRELRSGIIEDANGNLIFLPVIEYNISEDEIRTQDKKFPRTANGDVDLKAKHSKDKSWFLDSMKDHALLAKVKECSVMAFRVLHCRAYALFDIRADHDGNPFILEANLYCAFGPFGIINVMARKAGLSGKDVLDCAIGRAVRNESILNQ